MKNTFTVLRSKGLKVGAAAAALVSAGAAQASVLPSNFDTQMSAVSSDITTVGGALIALAVVAVGIKWVKATFFG